ncbi:cobalamin biosynthesis protein CobY [Saccharolobus solfataricus]|uniref:Cobalamin biosynthesis protein CobY n=2 Tax=Saccharolobus solfataricus TaxID=2287 RepID=A0A0E3KB43_SACSO|nr:NTP transferase domain-containing protein [Saccharolobus solfataricus]AKA73406.1 cobalamin biosynthesis protein CobY [Saccharolobus solfataricus]AKA76105.1 cobalamin biosynthesis protein CobY [Saccharolobus solfataricus]AKA78798.1 cobalamin biosynthesis protein CobY [Saccharolobus solfataricus]AZF67873.1 cobalamin biosynthesis protein CobY [Saccharolobus solfataricus]AZF70493.1 cobalamin biosynthesis protein CobY [Saccharolobus solfataricus]
MKVIILAGGRGKRITLFKPFLVVCGKPLISWAFDAVNKLSDKVYLGINQSHPLFTIFKHSIFKIFPTPDISYENDVKYVVESLGPPILVLPVDIAFINNNIINNLIERCAVDMCTLKSYGSYLGVTYWTGLNFSNYTDIEVKEKLYNINTWEDYIKANKECNIL